MSAAMVTLPAGMKVPEQETISNHQKPTKWQLAGDQKSLGLRTFHALTRWDTMSAASFERGKKTAWVAWNSLPKLTSALLELVHTPTAISKTSYAHYYTLDTIERFPITYVWQSHHLHKCTRTKLGRSSWKVLHSWKGFHQHMLLWNFQGAVMSGSKQLFHALCLLLQVIVLGSGLMLVYMNDAGPHLRKHQRHAMTWSLLRLQEGMSYPLQVQKGWTETLCTLQTWRGMSSKLIGPIETILY